ncbi:MAG TPA: SGNH/GDSL hydrolase family protein [Chryseosolibacter sp.]
MIISLLISLILVPDFNGPATIAQNLRDRSPVDSIRFFDGHEFDVIGKYHDEQNYVRFPAKYKNTLRENVWNLGQNSAGISIRFSTNAKTIVVRWTVLNDANLAHMPATGVKGVDLYTYSNGYWQYMKTGFPKDKTNESTLLDGGDGQTREYLLNLPLYDGVENLAIGINEGAQISKPHENYLTRNKPVVYYGTSIAQGGCASRPGLAFTNILSRQIDRPFINFGFSGNGTIETSVGEAMCEIDAALFVIDCNPNTKPELIYDRTVALVQMLNKQRPGIPVLLVEGFMYESSYFNPGSGVQELVVRKQNELKRAFDTLKKSGATKLFYKEGDGLIGNDHEGTVDGVHPNDIGMMRIAEALTPVLKKIL